MNSWLNLPMLMLNVLISLAYICISGGISYGSSVDRREEKHNSENQVLNSNTSPKPCCLPYKFQAVIADLMDFSADKKEVSRLYRDWENRIQIQESVVFNSQGIERSIRKIFMDYRNMKEYVVTPGGPCQTTTLDHGMLEPCMPESSTYLGKSYIGAYNDKTNFDAWNFRRTDLNRNIEMTIAVTSDKCIPVSEHITGRIGAGHTDSLVLFTNVTENVDDTTFNFPLECMGIQPM